MGKHEKQHLRIGICDDEISALHRLRQMTQEVLGGQWELEIVCTQAPQALLEQAEQLQIALLDIQLPERSGIALARILLEKSPQCRIIFVSGYVRFVSDVYDVPHLCMVLKDQMQVQLPKYLLRAADEAASEDGQLVIRSGGQEQTVELETVSYLERRGHVTYLNLENGHQIQTREKLDELLDRFHCPDLCRTHVSFAVNMRQTASLEEREFRMRNGGVVPISRANKQRIKRAYFDYLKRKL